MLEVRLLHTETRTLCDRLLAEQKISGRLLLDVLPASIAERLMGHTEVEARTFTEVITEGFAEVTIRFPDLEAFVQFSDGGSAEILLGVLEDISARLDESTLLPVAAQDQSIRQAYHAAVKVAGQVVGSVRRSVHRVITVLDAVDRFNRFSRYQLHFRLGLEADAAPSPAAGKRTITYNL
jgi:hypothetical protein